MHGRRYRSTATAVAALAVVLLLASAAVAHRRAGTTKPKVLTHAQAADRVLRAVEANDETGLHLLGERDAPDPWLIADELWRRGRSDVALLFAKAAPRGDTDRLPAYLSSRTDEASDRDVRAKLEILRAARRSGDVKHLREAVRTAPATGDGVPGVCLRHERGRVFGDLHLLGESAASFLDAADLAERIGWHAHVPCALYQVGRALYGDSDFRGALRHWRRCLAIFVERGRRVDEGAVLAAMGIAHMELGEHAEARDVLQRAVHLAEELDDREGLAIALVNLGLVHLRLGSEAEALECQERALALNHERGDQRGVARTLCNIGAIQRDQGAIAEAQKCLECALVSLEEVGDVEGTANVLVNIGNIHRDRGDCEKDLSCQQRALGLREEIGDRAGAVGAHANLGETYSRMGDYRRAREHLEKALALLEKLDAPGLEAQIQGHMGSVFSRLGNSERALEHLQRGLALEEKLGDRRGAADTLRRIGGVYRERGDYPAALRHQSRALALQEDLGDLRGLATSLGDIGVTRAKLGEYDEALRILERALALKQAHGKPADAARTLGNIGSVYLELGDHARALRYQERALSQLEDLDDRYGQAVHLGALGSIYSSIGMHAAALRCQERAVKVSEATGNRATLAVALGNVGSTYVERGEHGKALEVLRRALVLKEETGNRVGAATTLANIGTIHAEQGEYREALRIHEQVRERMAALGSEAGVASAMLNLGIDYGRLGEHAEAIDHLERTVRLASRLRAKPVLVSALTNLALLRLSRNEPARALLAAHRAMPHLEGLIERLGDEESAASRQKHAQLFSIGAGAAARIGEATDLLFFLESGRAGTLREALGVQRALVQADLPGALRRLEVETQGALTEARTVYERARATRVRADIHRARRALMEAEDRRLAAAQRIQREAKHEADLLYPRAATLHQIQEGLEDGEALVLYELGLGDAWALVVTKDAERIVSLGRAKPVTAACETLPFGPLDDAGAALAQLEKLLVQKLELPPSIDTVLVSPEGPLGYVPFGAIFEPAVAITPSGSTHLRLSEEEPVRGTQVLALGDPEYEEGADSIALAVYRRGDRLVSLPHTRTEARAVGDRVLLGRDANEVKLRETISEQRRWRAVHLACHGLLEPERPMLCSLALTRVGEEDGFLTALEISRMKIPADLAVLSACDTARGKIVQGDGIVGLTRAFMYAGAPRVLCSLWPVPDDATRALMTKFYELWNPEVGEGLPAARALKEAQAYVRGHAKWQHPHNWAAWVLWGLPR